jgi:pyruvate dehydrogenase complex dehydrogenase (E1) component
MPEFSQFPTVSMGLGPLMAIYQVRLLKYLHGRGIANTAARKVWAFMGRRWASAWQRQDRAGALKLTSARMERE